MNEESKKPEPEQKKTEEEARELKAPEQKAAAEQKPVAQEKKEPEKKPMEEKAKPAEEKAKKKKKINRFTLRELEKKIQEAQEKMGALTSTYARQLLKRQEQLKQGGDNARDA